MKQYVDVRVLSVTYGADKHSAAGTFQFRGEKKTTRWRATFDRRWNVTIDRELDPKVMKQMIQHIESVLAYVNLPIARVYIVEA